MFEEKYLGVHIDSELKFEEHIAYKVNKVNALVGLISRSFSYLDGELFRKLFTCDPTWNIHSGLASTSAKAQTDDRERADKGY